MRRGKILNRRLFVAGLALTPLLTLAACGAPAATPQANTVISVAEAPATTGNISSVFSYSASVSPTWTVTVLPQASGQIVDLKAKVGQKVNQGDLLASLDHRTQDDQVTQAQANVAAAQAKLDTLLAGARSEDIAAANAQAAAAQQGANAAGAQVESAKQKLAQAQAGGRTENIAQAQAKLAADQAALDRLKNGPISLDVTNAKLSVELAKDKLYADQTSLDAQVGRGQITKEIRQAALDADQTQIDQANTVLAKLVAPPRPEDVAQLEAAVEADKQALAVAQQPLRPEDIAQLQAAVNGAQATQNQAQQAANAAGAQAQKASSPYTGNDIAQAKAAVDVANASLQSAQTAQAYATVKAPAAAVVSEVPVAVGSLVSPQTPIATLISPDLQIEASVDQNQVALFKEGQAATINITGSSAGINGKVTQIAPSADTKTRKFSVKVQPTDANANLRSGMSATVSIQTGTVNGAVLVPKDAVVQHNGQLVVYTDNDGRAKMNPVQTGASDDKNIQITSGLQTSAKVILPGSLTLTDGDAVAPAGASASPAASASASPSQPAPAPSSSK